MSTTQAPATRREVLFVLPGLILAMLLAMLDQLIVGTAMPTIVGELGGVEHLSWVVTAYVLTSTVSTPLYGKLGDLYGRKRLFIFSIVVFLAGSALSGIAQSMAELIAFRAIQGLGAGGLMVGVMAIIGDLVSPRERGKYQGYFAATMAAATIAGPLLGGFLTDNLSWRWVFYINIPLGILALFVIAARLKLPRHTIKHQIDYVGAALLTVAATSIVLVTTWGGSQYEWGSVQIVGLAILGVAATIGFILQERRAAEPILPLHLFKSRNFAVTTVMGFLLGMGLFGAVTFLPLFQQTVQGASATNSGLLLLPLMGGSMVMSLLVGQIITRTGHYRSFPILGGAAMTAGVVLLSLMNVETTQLVSSIYMVVLGIGMGLLMQVVMLLAQNSVEMRDMGVASSTSMFARSIGGSLGVSLFGAIFANRLASALPEGASVGGGTNIDPAMLDQVPPQAREAILEAIVHATQGVFLWAVPMAALTFVLAWFLKNEPLRGAPQPEAEPPRDLEAVNA